MWRKIRRVSALTLETKEEVASVKTVRRIEVSVEREVCSLTVHGQLVLKDERSCPLCGQSLMAATPEVSGSLNELPRSLSNDEGN